MQLLWEDTWPRTPTGPLQPILRALPKVARETERCDAPAARAGEKAFSDWAGAASTVDDRHSAAVRQATVLVAVLGASSYIFAKVTRDQHMESWIRAHEHSFQFRVVVVRSADR